MANERLNIPEKLKVGFNSRSDTYSGKLAYVVYINAKGQIAKETSWKGWKDDKIPVEDYDNVPTEGFVLNRRAGGYASGWNHRQTYCRVWDPRGFEVEITVENLLFILQECTSTKGKGLEGEFVYAWDGKDLVLLPCGCEDYKASKTLQSKTEKIGAKDLIVGTSYKGKEYDNLIYLGKSKWQKLLHIYENRPYNYSYGQVPKISKYVTYKLVEENMFTFFEPNKKKLVGYKSILGKLFHKIQDKELSLDEAADLLDKRDKIASNTLANSITFKLEKEGLDFPVTRDFIERYWRGDRMDEVFSNKLERENYYDHSLTKFEILKRIYLYHQVSPTKVRKYILDRYLTASLDGKNYTNILDLAMELLRKSGKVNPKKEYDVRRKLYTDFLETTELSNKLFYENISKVSEGNCYDSSINVKPTLRLFEEYEINSKGEIEYRRADYYTCSLDDIKDWSVCKISLYDDYGSNSSFTASFGQENITYDLNRYIYNKAYTSDSQDLNC